MMCYVWIKPEAKLRCFVWHVPSEDGTYKLMCEFYNGKYTTLCLNPEIVDEQFIAKVHKIERRALVPS